MITITIEEIEIVVNSRVQEVVKEFKRMVPETKRIVGEIQRQIEGININEIFIKMKKTTKQVKSTAQSIKNSGLLEEINMKINSEDALEQIANLKKEINSLQKKVDKRAGDIKLTNLGIDKRQEQIKQKIKAENPQITDKEANKQAMEQLKTDPVYTSSIKDINKLSVEYAKYSNMLEVAKQKLNELSQKTLQTSSNQAKVNNNVKAGKDSLSNSETLVNKLKSGFEGAREVTKKITSQLGKMGSSIMNGIKNVLKYAMSLFSIQNIYGNLNSLGQNWLSSQDSGAKQLSTNIEYMKYAMGSTLAPIISYVTNLFYTLLKAVQSVVYALFKVNIFANSGAKAYANMTNSAKKTKDANNSLSGIHGEINNVSAADSNDGTEGGDTLIPTVDLSLLDSEITPLQQKMADFFRPLVDSWQTYSPELISKTQETIGQIGSLFGSIGQSFVNLFSNGTVYSILGNILGIIGNIAEAFSNAWNYNGNGDAIVQNLADTFNTLLGIIERIAGSQGFQLFLNGIISAFDGISTLIKPVIEDFFRLLEPILKIAMSGVGVILDIIGKAFKFIGENEIIVNILEAIAIAIGLVTAALTIYRLIQSGVIAQKIIETAVLIANAAAWLMANIPILLVVAAITAIIAIVILCIKHWEELGSFLSSIWEGIKQKAVSIWEGIKDFFMIYFEFVKNLFVTVWNGIKDFFINYFNFVKSLFENIWNGISTFISNIFNGIKNTINTILNIVFSIWSNIWNGIKNVITNVWNGIWGTIKGIINLILAGIEGMVNAVIKGVNFILSGISTIANAVGSIIGLDPINLQLNTISLPRLAKGGIIRNSTLALMGEYIGASQNPEIVTPQNLMYDTFTKALRENSNSGNPIEMNLVVQLGAEKIYQKFIEFVNYQSRVNGTSPLSINI